jgi:hypothetical protein
MISISIDATEVTERFNALGANIENFPPKMEEGLMGWQLDDVGRSLSTANVARPERNIVETRFRGRSDRALARVARRFMRRLQPRFMRQFRGFVRRGRRVMRSPVMGLAPAPVRRVRRVVRQLTARRPMPPVVRRARRMIRRQTMRVELVEALASRMRDLSEGHLTWR